MHTKIALIFSFSFRIKEIIFTLFCWLHSFPFPFEYIDKHEFEIRGEIYERRIRIEVIFFRDIIHNYPKKERILFSTYRLFETFSREIKRNIENVLIRKDQSDDNGQTNFFYNRTIIENHLQRTKILFE